MKRFIRIKQSEWLGGSNNKMMYVGENGDRYLGPPIQWMAGQTVIVEVSEGLMPDGLFHIIKVIGVTASQRRNG
jgi:hypothetical protein